MSNFSFEAIDIAGAYIVNSFFSEDNRGSFVKNYEHEIFRNNDISFDCDETFISTSEKYVIRGLHFQTYHPQDKLVGVLSGKVFDVIVDLRKESKTFGEWRGFYLSAENKSSLFIPKGCAHGFISLSDKSMVSYMCCGKYDKATDTGIRYDDPDIGIEWPINDMSQAIVGRRDMQLMSFADFKEKCEFTYN